MFWFKQKSVCVHFSSPTFTITTPFFQFLFFPSASSFIPTLSEYISMLPSQTSQPHAMMENLHLKPKKKNFFSFLFKKEKKIEGGRKRRYEKGSRNCLLSRNNKKRNKKKKNQARGKWTKSKWKRFSDGREINKYNRERGFIIWSIWNRITYQIPLYIKNIELSVQSGKSQKAMKYTDWKKEGLRNWWWKQ